MPILPLFAFRHAALRLPIRSACRCRYAAMSVTPPRYVATMTPMIDFVIDIGHYGFFDTPLRRCFFSPPPLLFLLLFTPLRHLRCSPDAAAATSYSHVTAILFCR